MSFQSIYNITFDKSEIFSDDLMPLFILNKYLDKLIIRTFAFRYFSWQHNMSSDNEIIFSEPLDMSSDNEIFFSEPLDMSSDSKLFFSEPLDMSSDRKLFFSGLLDMSSDDEIFFSGLFDMPVNCVPNFY